LIVKATYAQYHVCFDSSKLQEIMPCNIKNPVSQLSLQHGGHSQGHPRDEWKQQCQNVEQ
jgi:hypothetical protein